MKSNNKQKNRLTLKIASATFVLAFTMALFLTTMFTATKGLEVSYAAGETATTNTPPVSLSYSGEILSKPMTYMDATLPLGDIMKAKDTNGTVYDLYCVEMQNGVSGSGSYINPVRVPQAYETGLAWLIQNSYPVSANSKYMQGLPDNNTKKYVTQYAIWYYLDQNKVTYTSKRASTQGTLLPQLSATQKAKIDELANGNTAGSPYAKKVIELATDALNYNKNNSGATSIGLNTSNVTFTRSGDNLISNEISATFNKADLMDSTYTVAIDSNVNAKVVNVDGTPISSVSKNGTFKIAIPVADLDKITDGKVNIKLTATASFKSAVYQYSSTEQAPLIVADLKEQATAQLNIPITKITKIDSETKKPVSGATLKIATQDGTTISEFTTDGNPYYTSLQPGNYKLTETKAPDGYEVSKETKEFTVANDGTMTTVEFANTPKTPVPNTASNIPTYIYIIGALIIVAGAVVVCSVIKPKENK